MSSNRPLTIALFVLPLVFACAKKDADKVAEAQACVDDSTSSTVLTCLEKIDGVNTESANLIRCSAYFIYQDFADANRLAKVSKQLQNTSGSSTASAAAISLMAFTKPTAAEADSYSEKTFNYCLASKSKGMILLATMSRIATNIYTLSAATMGSTIETDCADAQSTTCQNAIAAASCDASDSTVGLAAQVAYQSSCAGSSQANSSVCRDFAALNASGGSSADVGAAVKDQIKGTGGCP